MARNQDQQWQAEADARTMASYQEIISDKARMGRAVREARKQAKALSDRAGVMGKVASVKGTVPKRR